MKFDSKAVYAPDRASGAPTFLRQQQAYVDTSADIQKRSELAAVDRNVTHLHRIPLHDVAKTAECAAAWAAITGVIGRVHMSHAITLTDPSQCCRLH